MKIAPPIGNGPLTVPTLLWYGLGALATALLVLSGWVFYLAADSGGHTAIEESIATTNIAVEKRLRAVEIIMNQTVDIVAGILEEGIPPRVQQRTNAAFEDRIKSLEYRIQNLSERLWYLRSQEQKNASDLLP